MKVGITGYVEPKSQHHRTSQAKWKMGLEREVGASGQVHLQRKCPAGQVLPPLVSRQRQTILARSCEQAAKLPDLKESLRTAKIKQRLLEDAAAGLQRPDPITPVNRITIQEALQKFVTQIELTKNPPAYKVYEQNLREHLEWTKLACVDQIDKDHLFKYRKHIMNGGNERLTAEACERCYHQQRREICWLALSLTNPLIADFDIELKWTALKSPVCQTMAMTTKTIPAYLEDERQKDCGAQLRMEEEAARIQPLNHGHHRTAKQPKLELPSVVKPAPKVRKTAAQALEEPHTARKTATKARKAA
jgi:hypothetical protein